MESNGSVKVFLYGFRTIVAVVKD